MIHNIPNVFVEVKYREKFSIYPALEQAQEETGGAPPVIFHRRSGKPWVAIMDARSFLAVMKNMRMLVGDVKK